MYAVELNGLHVGMRAVFHKKYMYGGQEREKYITIKKIYGVRHNGQTVSIYTGREMDGYYAKKSHFPLDTEVTVT